MDLKLGSAPTGGALTPGTPAKPPSEAPVVVVVATLSVTGATSLDERAVLSLRAGMRSCYAQALNLDPKAPEGSVTLTVVVSAHGEATSVTPSTSPLPAADVACVARRLEHASFDDASTGRTLVVTVEHKRAR